MNVHGLDSILKPTRIAITGVTINPNSVGGRVLRNLVGSAFRGVVYPVNPGSEAVMGVPCYPSIGTLPRTPDLVTVCSPAEDVEGILSECAEAGVKGVIIMSAGFGESGPEGALMQRKLAAIHRSNPGMRILGPNCLGVIVPAMNLNASFAPSMPEKGSIAFISQSGALCTSVLDWARQEKIGFSAFVSVGNALDVDFADLIDYFGEDDSTESIILYVESVAGARRFITAARAFARAKPIIVYKAGRFPRSAAVAASHTGAMVSEDAVYDAAFSRAGMARVLNVGGIFGCAELIGRKKVPRGPRLGIVSNAGGPGVMAVDALIAGNGVLAELTEESIGALDECLPGFWSGANPVDILGDAGTKRYEKASSIVLSDKGVDALLVILTPQAMTKPDGVARSIAKLAETTRKPILTAWMGGESVMEGTRILAERGIPVYSTPEQAVEAFMTLVSYSRNLESLHQTPRDIRLELTASRKQASEFVERACAGGRTILSELDSKHMLSLYGIQGTTPVAAATADSAVEVAEASGYPVVLKLDSPDITHKTEAGGVELNLTDQAQVRSAFARIVEKASRWQPGAVVRGVTVQRMARVSSGVEMILGFKRDPVFGSVIMLGAGGVNAEILGDSTLGFPPLNETLVMRMLEKLRILPLLKGYRGKPGVDMNALVTTVMRLSYLASDNPAVTELDINPLLVAADGTIALDARAVLDPGGVPDKPFGHLALRPYPEEFVEKARLKDGTEILLRPIRPEDEPMWLELLGSCSRESIYSRFRFFYNWESHEAAVRHCYIDYDRELAIVAEIEVEGGRKLLGVGRLVADPGLASAEYAVLVGDPWQNRGLGGILTDFCERIAREWGAKRIEAQTTSSNNRMVSLFVNRSWCQEPGEEGLVELWKQFADS